MPEHPPKPVLFIFDLDQTLIGPTFDLYAYQSMLLFARTLCAESPRDPSCQRPPQSRPRPPRLPRWHTAALRPDLVRPQLAELFAGIRRLFPTAEFALFSAGDAYHVHTFVPLIERVAGVRFLRPLFHRDHLTPSVHGTYHKSVAAILPQIVDALRPRYPRLTADDLRGRMVFIDDAPHNFDAVHDRIDVPCPAFTYHPPIPLAPALLHLMRTSPAFVRYIRSPAMQNAFDPAPQPPTPPTTDPFTPALLAALAPLRRYSRPFTAPRLTRLRRQLTPRRVQKK